MHFKIRLFLSLAMVILLNVIVLKYHDVFAQPGCTRQCVWYESQCARHENKCAQYENRCSNYSTRCRMWAGQDTTGRCLSHEKVCTNYQNVCVRTEPVCVKNKQVCTRYQTVCPQPPFDQPSAERAHHRKHGSHSRKDQGQKAVIIDRSFQQEDQRHNKNVHRHEDNWNHRMHHEKEKRRQSAEAERLEREQQQQKVIDTFMDFVRDMQNLQNSANQTGE